MACRSTSTSQRRRSMGRCRRNLSSCLRTSRLPTRSSTRPLGAATVLALSCRFRSPLSMRSLRPRSSARSTWCGCPLQLRPAQPQVSLSVRRPRLPPSRHRPSRHLLAPPAPRRPTVLVRRPLERPCSDRRHRCRVGSRSGVGFRAPRFRRRRGPSLRRPCGPARRGRRRHRPRSDLVGRPAPTRPRCIGPTGDSRGCGHRLGCARRCDRRERRGRAATCGSSAYAMYSLPTPVPH